MNVTLFPFIIYCFATSYTLIRIVLLLVYITVIIVYMVSSCQEEISGTSEKVSKSPQNPSSPCSNSAELIRTYSICGDLRGTFSNF